MMLERKDGVILAHSLAVVPHLDQPLPARKHADINSPALGIDGIFQQLLHDRGRPFDNFARSDFVCKNFRQYADFAHIEESESRSPLRARLEITGRSQELQFPIGGNLPVS